MILGRPNAPDGLSNVVAIAGGDSHSLALKGDGTVWAWGANFYGQLGNNSTIGSLVPVAVDTSGPALLSAVDRVVEISAGRLRELVAG